MKVINCDRTFSKSSALLSDSDSQRGISGADTLSVGLLSTFTQFWLQNCGSHSIQIATHTILLTAVICPKVKRSACSPFFFGFTWIEKRTKRTSSEQLISWKVIHFFRSVENKSSNKFRHLADTTTSLTPANSTSLSWSTTAASAERQHQCRRALDGGFSLGVKAETSLGDLSQWFSRHTSAKAWNPLAVSQTLSDHWGKVYDNGCTDAAACWRTSEWKNLLSRSMCVWRTKIEQERKNVLRTNDGMSSRQPEWSAINTQINTLFVGFVIHREHEILPQTANLLSLMASFSHVLPLSAYETSATWKNRRLLFSQHRFVILNIAKQVRNYNQIISFIFFIEQRLNSALLLCMLALVSTERNGVINVTGSTCACLR